MSLSSVLGNRGFRNLWLAQVVSRIGDGIHEIALIWLALEVAGDPMVISLVVLASLGPTVLTALPAGVLVDRMNRKYVLVGSNLVRGLAVLVIPLFAKGNSDILVPVLVGVALLTGIMDAFFGPAKNAVIPQLVAEEELDSANSLTEMTTTVSRMFYVLGGAVVAVIGAYSAFYIDAISFFVAAVVLLGLPGDLRPDREAVEDGLSDYLAEIREGVAYIRGSPIMLSLLALSALTGFALGPLAIVIPVFVDEVLQAGSLWYGGLYSLLYLGVFVGGIVVLAVDQVVADNRGRLAVASVFGMAVSLGIVAATPVLQGVLEPVLRVPDSVTPAAFVSGLGLVLFGVFFTGVMVPVKSIAQATVPEDKRGRVFSVWGALGLVAPPVSIVLSGPLMDVVGSVRVLELMAVFVLLSGLALSLTPLVRENRPRQVTAEEAVD